METVKLNDALPQDIDKCIRILSEKFRKWPYNFFTESDAHSYLYLSFFRYGSPALKSLYQSKDRRRSVLIHGEYPTFFRYSQKELRLCKLNESVGTCGHYDMVVLNPDFINSHEIQQVISKDNKIRQTVNFNDNHLLAAIEFKLLHKPLTEKLRNEIKKDFIKLGWALETRQARDAYMLIFNRYGEERDYWKTLEGLQREHRDIKLIYQESYCKESKHITYIKPYYQNPTA
ncbi:MAG: hypothetical protein COX41_05885 [Candidatus Omnitrophica bacterium CG23_combo_of_CG06-09_8_20_14_all_41_10]|uniref:Uncharacterized protein n=1 Tax=Candidatus Sherwoodlollariibacterium unditelluris TaxID=1974757 RepID=A0A2G9YI50_9BACT|nr:MAG: hypothetical protein COX41_05885 [Candidatus Omnitrophica bacterium CG23_combo_of_CG06-09_8_20_14_all_41_10]